MATDFNRDGRDDILWRRSDGALSTWLGQPDGSFGEYVILPEVVPSQWRVRGTGDFNGDGRADILWQNGGTGGLISNWLSNGNGFTINDANAMTTLGGEWYYTGIGDFNGDGRHDIVFKSDVDGDELFWFGTVTGGFLAGPRIELDPPHYSDSFSGDFNGDGRDELIWRNTATGAIGTWSLDGANARVYNNVGFPSAPSDWTVVGTGDFNGDGRDDILWRNSNGTVSDWLGRADGGFTINDQNAWRATPVEWYVTAVGDYNGDGRDDILWRNVSTGAVSDWLGTANGGFAINDAAAYRVVENAWVVQPNLSGAGEWDY